MMEKQIMKKFYQHAFPMQATLVTCRDTTGNTNIITVAWHTTLSKQPPLYGISIAPQRHSHDLIEENKEFVVNFLSFDHVDDIHYCGTHSGKNANKQEHTNLSFEPSQSIQTPGLKQAYARLECRVTKSIKTGDHTFFIGEVHHVSRDENAFDNDILQITTQHPTFYMGGKRYTNGKDQQQF